MIGYWGLGIGDWEDSFPVPSHQSPVPSHQSPVTSPQYQLPGCRLTWAVCELCIN
ncbi:hypothetical protein NIES4103_04120 [Nostoc sp. NIES-4103]|nr:hypothetical protein NIES4103_04120 [Nostoc sp. NIES-4103]